MARKRRAYTFTDLDEPGRDDEAWVDIGGDRIWAVDETPGGFPIGLTEREHRAKREQWEPQAGWARAKRALRGALTAATSVPVEVDVGWVRHLGSGLSVSAWTADVSVSPDVDGLSGTWVARLPREAPTGLPPETEAALLGRLAALPLPFRVPAAARVAPGPDPILVVRLVTGVPMELRADQSPFRRPWALVAEVAAAVHALPLVVGEGLLRGPKTRRAHALEWTQALEALDDRAGPLGETARAWAADHLPPDEPAALLHGDLLGQNLLIDPRVEPSLAVIDWSEACLGDPALDLAIVTRGGKAPFRVPNGLQRLVEAYTEAGGRAITASQVRLYELCLAARWFLSALETYPHSSSADGDLGRLRGVLRRAMA